MATNLIASPLQDSANKIVALGSGSDRPLSNMKSDFSDFIKFLESEKNQIEATKLPKENKIRDLSNINIVNTFGSAGGLLSSLLSGGLDLAGLIRGFFPGKGDKIGKNAKPEVVKPTVKGGRLRLGGLRALGVTNALFAGLDFATGLSEGESVRKSASGAAGSLIGGIGGGIAGSLLAGAIGQALVPIPGLGFVLGTAVGSLGSFVGGYVADRAYEGATGEGKNTLSQEVQSKLAENERRQKISAKTENSSQFSNTIEKFSSAVNRFDSFVAAVFGVSGLTGSYQSDAETGDELPSPNSPDSPDSTDPSTSGMGGTIQSDILEFRKFRHKQFGVSEQRFATSNPELYQIREMGIWDNNSEKNWSINPLADDTNYEKKAHEGAGHWENRAFDIPVPINSKEGDMVAAFWRRKGYKVLWKTDKEHENHVHVEIPRDKAKEFFKKSEESKNSDKSNIKPATSKPKPPGTTTTPTTKSKPISTTSPVKPQSTTTAIPTPTSKISSAIAMAPPSGVLNPQQYQEYPKYNQPTNQNALNTLIIERPQIIGQSGSDGGADSEYPIPIPTSPPKDDTYSPGSGTLVGGLFSVMHLVNLSAC